jgi:hypothetical protein
VAEEFSLQRMIRETECLYARLLENPPRRRRMARSVRDGRWEAR